MRKKSHISLAVYLVNDMQIPKLLEHRKAFYLGSILPDCKPSFLTQRHEFSETFEMVKGRIQELSADCELIQNNARVYMRRLGEVIHYLADYFTFPHNGHYDGNLKDHCVYENQLKFRLREYVKSEAVFQDRVEAESLDSVEAITSFIRKSHENYRSRKRCVEEDCKYIVRVCHQVVQAILHLLNRELGLEKDERVSQKS